MPRDVDIAWAAGLFEGEGSFSLGRKRDFAYARAMLTTTDLDVLERFRDIVGLGSIYMDRGDRPAHHKQRWMWATTSRKDFGLFAPMMRPYLGRRRAARLVEVINEATPIFRAYPREFCKRGHPLKGENLKVVKTTGKRACRTCIAANERRRYHAL